VQSLIPLSEDGPALHRQVYLGMRAAIRAGTFHGGDRLPSTRDLADQLGVSRTVVVLAYEQLLAEGFIAGRHGSGTYVADGFAASTRSVARPAVIRLSRFGTAATQANQHMREEAPPGIAPRIDFSYGRSNVDSFPFAMWRRLLARNARSASVRELDYGPATGTADLRDAIARHLGRSRAVVCDASQVIVTSGSQQALDLVARVLIDRGDRVAIENPAYQGTREILRAAGARLLPVPVDREGLVTAALPARARAVFVTPSHQFPTGAVLPLARRQQLLQWARARNAVVIEDDYDGEFRFEGAPLESLQGLDTEGRVIYVGTFSRTVFSALRIGYMVVPKPLLPAFAAAKWLADRHTATLEQQTLAEFISSGLYERHLRRVRRRNRAACAVLLDALEKHVGRDIEITGGDAGAHVVLWLARGTEQRVVNAAAALGVRVYGASPYFLGRQRRAGILLGYARLRENDIREGIRRLARVLAA
jgi:GntR family transcriptional regulator / MocR family aminotransferase